MFRFRLSAWAMFALFAIVQAGASFSLSQTPKPERFVLDMVYDNPGEAPAKTEFRDPKRLNEWGYTGQVVSNLVEGISTFSRFAPGVIPADSEEAKWADARTHQLAEQVRAAHAAGEKCYAWMQVFVLPRKVIERFRDEICDDQGRIDLHRPKSQELFRAQLEEIFTRLPDLDGLVIRTGEVYLHDLPYHAASGRKTEGKLQGGTAIIHGADSHIDILNVLREVVAEKFKKKLIYRTWDFGNNFHVNPAYYLKVTDAVAPHQNLIFSVKHQAGDFHQLTPFNPTLMIGKHRQIVEVQCQREAYGKGAHPYYIGQGVIEGWEEYAWMVKPGQPKGLRDIVRNPLFAGVWTWSRGGGWEGPYIDNELWCALNAYVVAQFVQHPEKPEVQHFMDFARRIGVAEDQLPKFRELCLLSTKAVLRGQLTTLRAGIDVWWARDDNLAAPDLRDFIRRGLVDKVEAEKAEAVDLWRRIVALANAIELRRPEDTSFMRASCEYGRIKYAIFQQIWTMQLLVQSNQVTPGKAIDLPALQTALERYDSLWQEWRAFKQSHPDCPTLYKDVAHMNSPGIGAAVDKYRALVAAVPATRP